MTRGREQEREEATNKCHNHNRNAAQNTHKAIHPSPDRRMRLSMAIEFVIFACAGGWLPPFAPTKHWAAALQTKDACSLSDKRDPRKRNEHTAGVFCKYCCRCCIHTPGAKNRVSERSSSSVPKCLDDAETAAGRYNTLMLGIYLHFTLQTPKHCCCCHHICASLVHHHNHILPRKAATALGLQQRAIKTTEHRVRSRVVSFQGDLKFI